MPQMLKEEDRLAATVELITEDAAIIPRGAWFKCPDNSVIENSNFEGLCATDAAYLMSYLHARPPKEKWNTNLLTRPDYNYALDFLDSIDMDVPQGNSKCNSKPNFDLLTEVEAETYNICMPFSNVTHYMLFILIRRKLEFAISVGWSFDYSAQSILAWNDVLS